jgi:hypothetical protein
MIKTLKYSRNLFIIIFAANALRAAAGRVLLDFMFAIRSHVQ